LRVLVGSIRLFSSVSVIDYCDLGFVCDLVLGIWDLIYGVRDIKMARGTWRTAYGDKRN